MSGKRGAESYLTKDGVNSPSMGGHDDVDPVQRATAAQLASRKIKAAKGRRPGAAAARPTTSFGLSANSQPSLFSNGSQSFPPTNGASPSGNGSPSVSFGGFGNSSGGGTGFNFSASAPVSNPFANSSASTTNGASSSGFGFNFGQTQPSASQTPSNGIFSFQGSQQSASQPSASLFSSATSHAPSTGMFGSNPTSGATGSSLFGAPAASTAPGSSLFGGTNGSSTFGASSGSGIFGTAPSTSQQPSGGSLFGRTIGQAPSPAPFNSFFGGGTTSAKPAFGQPTDDAMSTSPDNSPSRSEKKPATNHWNKPLETFTNGTSNGLSSNGGDSPDHPHIEEEKSGDNPFAVIARPPPVAPKIAEKSTKPLQQTEEDKPHIEEEDKPKSNPFAAIARPPPPTPAPTDSQPKPNIFQTSTSSASGLFNLGKSTTQTAPSFTATPQSTTSQPSSIFGQKPTVGEAKPSNATTTQPSTIFKANPPSTTTSSSSTNTESFSSTLKPTQSAPTLPVSAQSSLTPASQGIVVDSATAARLREVGTVLPQDRVMETSKYLSPEIRNTFFSEENIIIPTSDSGDTEEEIKYQTREQKLRRLNNGYKIFFANAASDREFPTKDLRPFMANYIAIYEELMAPIQGPLSTLIATHGKEQGYRLFHQQSGRIPDDSGKRRLGEDVSRGDDNGKKTKTEATSSQSTPQVAQSSETANKFMSFLDQSTKSASSNQSGTSASGVTATSQSTAPSAPTFKMPTFGTAAPGNFLSQFGQKAAKTAAEEKQKAKDEDFDSDEDDPVEWDRKYEEEQAAKKAKLQEEQAKLKPTFIPGQGFTFGAPASTPSQPKDETGTLSSTNGGFFPQSQSSSLVPPSTNGGLFSSRSVSPAASTTGGASIFDGPRSSAPSANNNIFGHLSDRGSDVEGSAKGDADDEGSDEEDESQQSKREDPPSERSSGRFGGFSESDDVQSDTPTASRSLFDRISKPADANGSATPSGGLFDRITRDDASERTPLSTTAANEGGLFGSITKTSGDQTWNPASPIKFGPFGAGDNATVTPKFSFAPATPTKPSETSSLFGTTTKTSGFQFTPIGSTTPTGSATPKVGSLFGTSKPASSLFPPTASSSVMGSGVSSRATTPGVSDVSGAESTAGEQEETSKDPQSDLVGLLEDKRGHDVLFESGHAKACRYETDERKRKDNNSWPVQGLGPIAVLKDQATGVTKILMKKVPGGGIVINARLLPQFKYERPGDKGKRSRFHTLDPETKKPLSWLVQFGTEEEAADFVKACEENK